MTLSARILTVACITGLVFPTAVHAEPAAPAEKVPAKENDLDLGALLLGSWRYKQSEDGVTMEGITTYKKDGTWSGKGSVSAEGQKIDFAAEGKWKLEGKKLSFEVTKSSEPDLMEVGLKWDETVISISEKEFRYLDEDGKEVAETRVKPEEKEKEGKAPE